MKSEINKKGLSEHFIFEGFVKPEQALSLSDITVLPSLEEGFAIVSIESFLMKKLHIRTKTAGYNDMRDCCIGVEIGNDTQLQKAIEDWLDGKDFSRLINHAFETVYEKFTINKMVDRILDIYQEYIKQRG